MADKHHAIRLMNIALDMLFEDEYISEGCATLLKRIRDDCVYGNRTGKIKMSTIEDYKQKFPEEFEDKK